jgi:squalene-hopene/tetraprenyl-beta-curcumene cyclase
MKLFFLILTAATLVCAPLFAEEPIARRSENVSFRNEIQLAIDKGLTWLKENQKPDGYWSTEEHPALTALPLLAFHREPTGKYREGTAPFLQKGYDFIRAKAKPDGGIYGQGLSNYNTSLALVALLTTRDKKDEPLITKARDFIVAQQASGMANESLDGGIGYGPTGVSPKRQHPDLDNTLISIEALQAYRAARPQVEAKHDLNWQAAIDFISRTQNLPSHNPKGSAEPADKGGFIYYPGFSNADPAEGPKALRSYGSMSYAGLLSFIYADLKKEDPRVVAALEWLTKNFTLEENPGMGRAGLYYYYHLMSKGLVAAGVDKLELADGKKVNWAPVLAGKLMQLQQGDGSWVNDTARWMEKDPVLVTCYCVLTLEAIYNRL